MDFERPRTDYTPTTTTPEPASSPVQNVPSGSKKTGFKKILMVLVLLLAMGGAAFGGYYYADQQAKDDREALQAQQDEAIAQLNLKITQLQYELESSSKQITTTP